MGTMHWAEPATETHIVLDVDVLVVGGGPSGVAAAVGAARTGAKAAIVERDSWLGGQAAMIFSIAPWQFIDDKPDWVVGGITREIFLRTADLGGCDYLWETVPDQVSTGMDSEPPFTIMGNGWSAQHKTEGFLHWRDATVEPQSLRFALHQLCQESDVTLLLDCVMAGVMMEDNRIIGVQIEFRGQRFGVTAKVVVDATGHGDVAARAGCAFENYYDLGKPGRSYPRSYAGAHSRIANVAFSETLQYMRDHRDQWRFGWGGAPQPTLEEVEKMVHLGNTVTISGFQELRWKAVQENPDFQVVGRVPGTLDTPKGYLVFSYQGDGLVDLWSRSRKSVNLLSPIEFSNVAADIRKVHWLTHQLYRDYVPGFQNSRFVSGGAHVGTAYSRRIAVEYTLTREDLAQGTHFDDVVGRAIGHDWHVVAMHRGFEIPYRALLPQGVEGLLVTGKSAGQYIHTVAPTGCTGHAAGVAAALAAKTNQTPRQVDVALLQKTLLDQGAVL